MAFEKRNKKSFFFSKLFFPHESRKMKRWIDTLEEKIVEGSMGFLIGVKGIIFTAKKCKKMLLNLKNEKPNLINFLFNNRVTIVTLLLTENR